MIFNIVVALLIVNYGIPIALDLLLWVLYGLYLLAKALLSALGDLARGADKANKAVMYGAGRVYGFLFRP